MAIILRKFFDPSTGCILLEGVISEMLKLLVILLVGSLKMLVLLLVGSLKMLVSTLSGEFEDVGWC